MPIPEQHVLYGQRVAALIDAANKLWEDAIAGGDNGWEVFSISRDSLARLATAVAAVSGDEKERGYARELTGPWRIEVRRTVSEWLRGGEEIFDSRRLAEHAQNEWQMNGWDTRVVVVPENV